MHKRLLAAAGVPDDVVIVEDRSTTTEENVTMSLPLIAEAVGEVRSVIAVVKWYHRRALVAMARHAPQLGRIYAADYEPFDVQRRAVLGRENWADAAADSVERETRYMRELVAGGAGALQRTNSGWVRTTR